MNQPPLLQTLGGLLLLLGCWALPAPGRAQTPAPTPASAPPAITGAAHAAAAEAAVRAVVQAANAAWMAGQVDQAMAEYTDDAYWINAFGIERHGRAEIQPFLTRLFANAGFRAATPTTPFTIQAIRFVGPDVALVHVYAASTGQLTNSGQPLGDRKTHVFRMLVRRQGRWLTDSFQVLDERERKP